MRLTALASFTGSRAAEHSEPEHGRFFEDALYLDYEGERHVDVLYDGPGLRRCPQSALRQRPGRPWPLRVVACPIAVSSLAPGDHVVAKRHSVRAHAWSTSAAHTTNQREHREHRVRRLWPQQWCPRRRQRTRRKRTRSCCRSCPQSRHCRRSRTSCSGNRVAPVATGGRACNVPNPFYEHHRYAADAAEPGRRGGAIPCEAWQWRAVTLSPCTHGSH